MFTFLRVKMQFNQWPWNSICAGRENLQKHRQRKTERVRERELVLWAQSTTKDYIRAEHKLLSISKLLISQVICFWTYLYSVGTQHGNLHPARWPSLFWGPTQEPVLAAANTGKTCELEKNAGDWTGRVEISLEQTPGSKHSMHVNILTYSRLSRENLLALCSHQMGL